MSMTDYSFVDPELGVGTTPQKKPRPGKPQEEAVEWEGMQTRAGSANATQCHYAPF